MERFHFNVRRTAFFTPDEEGEELEPQRIVAHTNKMAIDIRDMQSLLINFRDCAFEVTNATGEIVYRLRFEDAAAPVAGTA